MPFKSKAQWRMMFARRPRAARRWAHETPGGYRSLPDYAGLGAVLSASERDACVLKCAGDATAGVEACKKAFPVESDYDNYSMCVRTVKDRDAACRKACGGKSNMLALAGVALIGLWLFG